MQNFEHMSFLLTIIFHNYFVIKSQNIKIIVINKKCDNMQQKTKENKIK